MEKLKFQTKSDGVYQELKQEIINGKYKPQERIIISEVAKAFGTSDIPVREAIKQLESDGLIQNTPYVGAVVTSFDLDDIKKIFEIRTVLEAIATRLAAKNIDKKKTDLLTKSIKKMERAVQSKRYGSLAQLNQEFHSIIYSASGNEYLKKIIFVLWDFSLRSRAIFSFMPEWARQAVTEHHKMLAALTKGDEDLAEKLILKHMKNSLKAFKLYFKKFDTGE